MVQADELTANVKHAESALSTEQKTVEADRTQLTVELGELKAALERISTERRAVVAGITPQVLATFDQVSKRRNGVAVAEAREGICTICHVRLRPQVFNTVLRNEAIMQCDHCQRILFYVPNTAPGAPGAPVAPDTPGAPSDGAGSTAR